MTQQNIQYTKMFISFSEMLPSTKSIFTDITKNYFKQYHGKFHFAHTYTVSDSHKDKTMATPPEKNLF